MGHLILEGGGSYPQTRSMDQVFFDSLKKEDKILYLPIALVGDADSESCHNFFSSMAADFGFPNFEMWLSLAGKSKTDLFAFRGIYIGGGNTYKLLSDLRTTGFDLLLKEFMEQGGVVCGGSAGAIIFGKHILSARDANVANLSSSMGMDMLNGMSIWCHYREDQDSEVSLLVKTGKSNVIGLDDLAGISISDGKLKTIGESNVCFFTDKQKQKLSKNSIIDFDALSS